MKLSYINGALLVLLAGTFWSFIPLGIRGFQYADVWQILFYRSIGVLPLIYVMIYVQTGENPITAIRASGYSAIVGAIGLVIAYAGGISAIRMTTIANAAFLFATAPFFAAIFSKLILGESLRRFTIVALSLALCGTFIMVYDAFSAGHWLGNFLALLSAIGFAIFAVSLRATTTSTSLPIVFLGTSFAVVLALVMCLLGGSGFYLPTQEIMLAIGLGVFVLGVGMVLCTLGASVVPAAELTLLCMTEITFAPIWAWLFLDEIPTAGALLGGSVIVSAIVLNAVSGMRHKRPDITTL